MKKEITGPSQADDRIADRQAVILYRPWALKLPRLMKLFRGWRLSSCRNRGSKGVATLYIFPWSHRGLQSNIVQLRLRTNVIRLPSTLSSTLVWVILWKLGLISGFVVLGSREYFSWASITCWHYFVRTIEILILKTFWTWSLFINSGA